MRWQWLQFASCPSGKDCLVNKNRFYSMFQAFIAAFLFGASAPIAKLLLGSVEPIPMASFLYLGSGFGLLIYKLVNKHSGFEAKIDRTDVKWLLGAILAGGVIAPIVLMFSLRNTPASTASLLLNFESVATTLIAVIIFKEAIGKHIWTAIILMTSASVLLTLDFKGEWGFSFGALGIVLACVLWGIDNNFTRNISTKDPLITVTIKGIVAGSFSLVISFITNSTLPGIKEILVIMLLGFFCYGLSIVLFIFAMRELGASRTSAFFSTAPFIGVLLSFVIFRELPNIMYYIAFPIMIIGAIIILLEEHSHTHLHEFIEHNHRHRHDDLHHGHNHIDGIESIGHSHLHTHTTTEHSHKHTPDTHHRHEH